MTGYKDEDLVERRLRWLLCLTTNEAKRALESGSAAIDVADVAARVGLSPSDVKHIASSHTAILDHRVDPNRMAAAQADLVPGMNPTRTRMLREGRPFFSHMEVAEATKLPIERVEDLFNLPTFKVSDPFTNATRAFEPIAECYVLPRRVEFESVEHADRLGYVVQEPSALVRVIVPSDLEDASPSYAIKPAYGGRLAPLLRDDEGFVRILVPGAVDVWVGPATGPEDVAAIADAHGLNVVTMEPAVGYYLLEMVSWPADMNITRATLGKIDELNRLEEVAFSEPAEVGRDDFGPLKFSQILEFEDATGGDRRWNRQQIRLTDVHNVTTGHGDVTIIVVDSGIRLDHPDLAPAIRPDWADLDLNFDVDIPAAASSPEALTADERHGTGVAGIAGGRAPATGWGVRGVAPGCPILPLKVSGRPWSQSYGLRAAAILAALGYIESGKRAVINISWSTAGEHIGIREALIRAAAADVAIVTSAGNYLAGETQSSNRPHYPSQYCFLPTDTDDDVAARRKIRGLCSVAAVDAYRKKASYSYFGAQSVSFAVPGGEAGSQGSGIFLASTPDSYTYSYGTSYSAPHVAGVIALMLSLDPSLPAQDAVDILAQTAINVDAENPGFAGHLGAGLVDAAAALHALEARLDGPAVAPDDGRSPAPDDAPAATPQGDALININAAGAFELATLPNIGSWSASVIVTYRAEHGPYADIWALSASGAVDRWTVDSIEDLIVAGGPASGGVGVSLPPSETALTPPQTIAGAQLNMNAATAAELDTLPFVGAWSAERIVAFRTEHGPFATVEDLPSTGALDGWTLDRIRHLITVG